MYYKLKWLRLAGVKVHLHCFAYGRQEARELSEVCETVHYYARSTGWRSNLSFLPYTVSSRRSRELRNNLLGNDHPILFEVLHTCYLLKDPAFRKRKKIYRHSNIEHIYYREIARAERSLFRKIFHYVEAWRLKRFEKVLAFADLILAVSETDAAYFREKFKRVRCVYLPSFHPNRSVNIRAGKGEFALFHGNLSVPENYNAALWLLQNVLVNGPPAVVAGLNPPRFLERAIAALPNVRLVPDPSPVEMERLVENAQVHLLYTSQETGLKLKLLNVVFAGRFILCNSKMLSGTGIKPGGGLVVADSADTYRKMLEDLMGADFPELEIKARENMASRFSNQSNVQKLIAEIGMNGVKG